VRLSCLDHGGEGTAALLLHGLCGEAREWAETARWLRESCRVVALDQRGHGASERVPGRYGRDDYVADAVAAIEQLGLTPVVLIGQSMGGLNAYLVAARRPELVRALVVAEAQCSANPDGMRAMREWLRSLPVPFPSGEEARAFMQTAGFPGEAWQELLEEGPGGWRPRFDVEGAIDSTVDTGERDCWDEWQAIRCATLVVGGAQSPLSQAELRSMASRLPCGRYAVVEGAGHNVHLDRPDEWRTVVEGFLREQKLGVRRPAGP
jgi:pimeloyl-ACP methyl ester carboxylesterase